MHLYMRLSKELYKQLRIQCTQGADMQNRIYEEYGIELDTENLEDYCKYLVNLSVANTQIQSKLVDILPLLPMRQEIGRFVIMIANNILSDSCQYKDRIIYNNPDLVNFCIDSIADD